MRLRPDERHAGAWDYDGACAPTQDLDGAWRSPISGWETFSLGCFQWIPKAGGKGFKRGKVVKRIQGVTHAPQDAYNKAEKFCRAREVQP